MSGNATKGKQDEIIAAIGGISGGGDASAANQTTMISHLSALETNTDNLTSDPATATLQGTIHTKLTEIDTMLGSLETLLIANNNNQSTAVLQGDIKTKLDTIDGVLDNVKTNTDNLTSDPATATLQAATNTKLDNLMLTVVDRDTNTTYNAPSMTVRDPLTTQNIVEGSTDSAVRKTFYGYNSAVGTSWETIGSYTGSERTFYATTTFSLSSSDANDDMEVTIVALDASGDPVTEVVRMNGTTAVVVSATSAYWSNPIDFYISGAGLTGGSAYKSYNIGTISLIVGSVTVKCDPYTYILNDSRVISKKYTKIIQAMIEVDQADTEIGIFGFDSGQLALVNGNPMQPIFYKKFLAAGTYILGQEFFDSYFSECQIIPRAKNASTSTEVTLNLVVEIYDYDSPASIPTRRPYGKA